MVISIKAVGESFFVSNSLTNEGFLVRSIDEVFNWAFDCFNFSDELSKQISA